MTDDTERLKAARATLNLLISARSFLTDAQRQADDGRLAAISKSIRERVESLDDELLKEARALVAKLENAQPKNARGTKR